MQISIFGQTNLVKALPKSCECMEMHWTRLGSMGQTAGLEAYTHIKKLSLQGFRCGQHLRVLFTPCTVQASSVPLFRMPLKTAILEAL